MKIFFDEKSHKTKSLLTFIGRGIKAYKLTSDKIEMFTKGSPVGAARGIGSGTTRAEKLI